MDCGHERCCVFSIARCDAPPPLEMEEGIFNQVSDFIEVFVILTLNLAVLSRRNDGCHALLLCLV